jgi:hypothetical protein
MVNLPKYVVMFCLNPENILLSRNLFLSGEQKIGAYTESKIDSFTLMYDSLIRLNSNWVRILAVLIHLVLKNGAFVPHNMIPVKGILFIF